MQQCTEGVYWVILDKIEILLISDQSTLKLLNSDGHKLNILLNSDSIFFVKATRDIVSIIESQVDTL